MNGRILIILGVIEWCRYVQMDRSDYGVEVCGCLSGVTCRAVGVKWLSVVANVLKGCHTSAFGVVSSV